MATTLAWFALVGVSGFSLLGYFVGGFYGLSPSFAFQKQKVQFFNNVLSLYVYFGDTGRVSADANCPF